MPGLVPFNRNVFNFPAGFEDFYNMLDDFFSDTRSPRRSLAGDTFKIDVQDTGSEYLIEAELPGVKKEEIGLQVDEGKLTIMINREENTEDKGKNYVHKERRFSSMQRSVYLVDVKTEAIMAKLEEGILKIIAPKMEKKETSTKIEIQ